MSARTHDEYDESFEHGGALETLARLAWLVALAGWLFVAASMLGYSPADPPGHAVWPVNETVANWCGPVGAWLAHHAITTLGFGTWILLLGIATASLVRVFGHTISQPVFRGFGLVLFAVSVSGGQALFFRDASSLPEGGGGVLAIAGVDRLMASFDVLGTTIWISLLMIIGAVVAFDRWLIEGPRYVLSTCVPVWYWANDRRERLIEWREERREARELLDEEDEEVSIRENDVDDDERVERPKRRKVIPVRKPVQVSSDEEDDEDDVPGAPQVFDPEALREKIGKLPVRFAAQSQRSATEEDLASLQSGGEEIEGYQFPTLGLLEDPETQFSEKMESFVRQQAEALEEAMKVYKIEGEVVGIDSGPVITLYEVRLAPGTKVSRMQTVSSDLARALKAINIRIVPNMVGKDTVGIEVPNAQKERVRLKELMGLAEERASSMRLPMFLGKDASGEPMIEDLTKMPHLLIAGTTGSGKSVCMNTIIMSFLYTKKPNELKLVLMDPKMVELSMFRDIPHLMCPVVTEMSKAAAILEWAVTKMDERYSLLAEAGVRDIASYNELEWEELKERFDPQTELEEAKIPRKLPYLVFMIDELADLMMTHKEVEDSIVRIAQKARAVGLHLILATQRPQANVVTGLIKSNMPGRICFKVASGMDSRIVMDQKGGELLLGQGDMLYLSPRSHKIARAQGTLVEDREARKVVRFLKEIAAPSFERQLVQIKSDEPNNDGLVNAQEDPLFDKAVEIVLETKRGSVSLLQRRLAIGYTRSSRLIDMMGEAGIIGEYKGTVAREVAITPEEWEAMKAQAAADAAGAEAQVAEATQDASTQQGELFEEVTQIATKGSPDPATIHADVTALIEDDHTEDEETNDVDEPVEDEEPEILDEDEIEDEEEDYEVVDAIEGVQEDSEEEDEEPELEGEDDEEIEYVYVDEDGNEIDPEDVEYEIEDEYEEEDADEDETVTHQRAG
ncbi:MAG: DNA translocase FtsK [Planctomycetota bacterium]|jgi:S-DNA-T family DNA segregation ATPase FtsK/SpoIIIE